MDKIVIAGIDSILGSNMAAALSDRYQVVGLSLTGPVTIAGCETAICPSGDPHAIARLVAAEQPQWLVYCGPAARSTWNGPAAQPGEFQAVQLARPWAQAAAACGCEYTLISSDAVFTGPWMFHSEEGTSLCPSPAAQAIRAVERDAMAIFPRTLVVRTNVFGWSPLPQAPGLVERLLSQGEDDTALPLDCVRHATPILATDLVEILEQAYGRRLQGVYHIGGAERVNPARFGALLAAQFNCRYTLPAQAAALAERRMEFGGGETSLQGRKIRNELDLALPLLREGLGRLYAQSLNGFRDRFEQSSAAVQDMVA